MPNPNTKADFGQLDSTLHRGAFHVNIVAPADGTYDIALESPGEATITEIVAKTASGTCTIETRIDNVGVTVTGSVVTMSITSTKNNKAAIGTNAIGQDSRLTLVVSASAAPTSLALTIHYTRTG
ncbi:MAG: hypothetical protein RIS45_667 [Planctomycetota bacterium]|jgi:hypothetical protein